MVSENLLANIKIPILVKYWYLVGILRWENLCVPDLLFRSILLNHVHTRMISPRYKGSCMVYRPKWYWKCKYHPSLGILYWYQEMWNPQYGYPIGIQKRLVQHQYQPLETCLPKHRHMSRPSFFYLGLPNLVSKTMYWNVDGHHMGTSYTCAHFYQGRQRRQNEIWLLVIVNCCKIVSCEICSFKPSDWCCLLKDTFMLVNGMSRRVGFHWGSIKGIDHDEKNEGIIFIFIFKNNFINKSSSTLRNLACCFQSSSPSNASDRCLILSRFWYIAFKIYHLLSNDAINIKFNSYFNLLGLAAMKYRFNLKD